MHLIKKLKNILKLKTIPWITAGIQNSIKTKNRLFKNYINKKDSTLKNEIYAACKKYRNMLSTLKRVTVITFSRTTYMI